MNEDVKKILRVKIIGGRFLSLISKNALSYLSSETINAIDSKLQSELELLLREFNSQTQRVIKEANGSNREPLEFRKQVEIFLAHEHAIKPIEAQFYNTIKVPPRNVFASFVFTIRRLVHERRLLKRYLKARFGIKRIGGEFLKQFPDQLDRIVFASAFEVFVNIDTQLLMWLCAIENSTNYLHPNLATLLEGVFIQVSHGLSDFRPFMMHTKMNASLNDSLNTEAELASLAAWAEANISFSATHNPRLAKTVEREGEINVKGDIPTSVLIALNAKAPDEPYSSGTRKTSVISRISNLLENKSLQHEEDSINEVSEQALVETFSATVEAKIDLTRIIDQANLTDRAKSIVFMKDIEGMSFEKIAEELSVKKSTISTTYYRAIEKLSHTLSEKK